MDISFATQNWRKGDHRLGNWGGRGAEPECDVLAVVDNVVGDHADDPADGLGE